MNADLRHQRILQMLSSRGYAGIDELVARFAVTPQTIRRDLQDLAERGLLRRHHGGASLASSIANTDYVTRHVENAAEKLRIARAAASLVPTGSSVFMTPGTTVEAAARVLAEAGLGALRVITNSTAAAAILGADPNITIQVTGGTWQANNRALGGPAAAEAAERYRCDILLTSIGAIDSDGWLLEFHEREVVVARTMLANARRRVLLADHTKFARVAACKLARLCDMTTLVTDRPPPGAIARMMEEAGVELIIPR